jgi:prepilin-type N-terminal cleavage/methylation domain-containing protein
MQKVLSLSLSLSRNRPLNKKLGFTLLEILLVVGIISLLAGIVIIAINPGKQLATVRNTERKSDIKQINSALTQYYIDHNILKLILSPTMVMVMTPVLSLLTILIMKKEILLLF